jgi:RNA polymerase sigma-70 factor, ECF subfamily
MAVRSRSLPDTPARSIAAGGHPHASAAAFADHFDYLCLTLRRFGVPPADVEDLAQDVFLVMCRRWSEYRRERPLRSWLAGIAFNVARKHRGKLWRETLVADVDLPDQASGPDERLQIERTRLLALRALASLSARDRHVLILHDIDGLPMQEIASLLDVPLFTAYTRLRRARLRFARATSAMQGDAPLSAEALLAGERQAPPTTSEGKQRAWQLIGATRTVAPQRSRVIGAGLRPLAAIAAAAGLAFVLGASLTRLPRRAGAPGPDLGQGLVGYWPFDEGPGSATARDRSPAGRDCRLRDLDLDGARVDGARGRALDLRRGWVECPQPPLRATARDPMTVSAWIDVTGPMRGHLAIVSRQLGQRHTDYFFFGLIGRRLKVRSSLWEIAVEADRPLPPGRWIPVAFTHSADGTTRLFQDGVEVGAARATAARTARVDTPLVIGAGINGPGETERGEQFAGSIDEVALFARPLSPAQIAALAHGAQPVAAR